MFVDVWRVPGPLLLAFGMAIGVTWFCCRPGSWLHFLDHPNERSLHSQSIPRTGGVGVMTGLLAGWLYLFAQGQVPPGGLAALGGAMALAALGLLDDRRGLSARIRLLAQLAAAGAFLGLSGALAEGVQVVVVLLALVWMANLYNFMDGSDGLAGGMALFGFGAYAAAAASAGQPGLAMCCGCVAAAAAGFLCFNFHPARIFMGDVGSVPLGFLAGTLGVVGARQEVWPLWFPVLVFSPFIVDATVTLLRRAWRGEKVWQAHRSHYYQRLVQLGVGHRGTALRAYGLMILAGASAVLALDAGFLLRCGIFIMWVVVYALSGYLIDRAWRRHNRVEAKRL